MPSGGADAIELEVGESSLDVFGCKATKKRLKSATLLTVKKAHVDACGCFRHSISSSVQRDGSSSPDGMLRKFKSFALTVSRYHSGDWLLRKGSMSNRIFAISAAGVIAEGQHVDTAAHFAMKQPVVSVGR